MKLIDPLKKFVSKFSKFFYDIQTLVQYTIWSNIISERENMVTMTIISMITCDHISHDLKGLVGLPWSHPWTSDIVENKVFEKLAKNGIIAKPVLMQSVNPMTEMLQHVFVLEIASDKLEINPAKMSSKLRNDVNSTVVLALLDYFQCDIKNIAKFSQIEINTYVDSSKSTLISMPIVKNQKLQ